VSVVGRAGESEVWRAGSRHQSTVPVEALRRHADLQAQKHQGLSGDDHDEHR